MTVASILVGILVGFSAAWLHQWASWRASTQLVTAGRRSVALLGLPLRVCLPAAALFVVSRWTSAAFVAALVAFGVVEVVAVRRRLELEGPPR